MTTVLVIGATGNVGAHVVRNLISQGADVRAFARDPGRAAALHVPRVLGDLDDPASVKAALVGVDRVFLTTGDGPAKVRQECTVIDAAEEAGVELVVKLSAMHADPASNLPVFAWHGAVEAHLRSRRQAAVVLQPAFFMSNLLMVAGGVAATGELAAPTGGAKVAMVDVRDVGAVAATILGADGHSSRTVTVTGPEAITFAEVATALRHATGRGIRSVDLTPEQARPRFEGAGLPDWLQRHLAGVFQLIRDGEFAQVTDAVRRITGTDGTTIDTFARDHGAAFSPQVDQS